MRFYKDELAKVCDELLEYDDLRNLMAHGFMMLTTDRKDNHEFEFRLYQREDRDKFNLIKIQTTLPYLRVAAAQITEYVSHAVSLFGSIYLEQKIEHSADSLLIEKRDA
jgi:ribosomal protein S2